MWFATFYTAIMSEVAFPKMKTKIANQITELKRNIQTHKLF